MIVFIYAFALQIISFALHIKSISLHTRSFAFTLTLTLTLRLTLTLTFVLKLGCVNSELHTCAVHEYTLPCVKCRKQLKMMK